MQYPAAPLVCLSHLRWNFVFQRPQHLMVRFARERRVFFVEEPVFDADEPRLDVSVAQGVHVAVPHLPPMDEDDAQPIVRRLIQSLLHGWAIERPVLWLYTPLALPLVDGVDASAIVYDCMDELSGFAGASPRLGAREKDLLACADVVFTGGHSLYEAKCAYHHNIHPCPSSVDVAHFAQARRRTDPDDQRLIGRPRIGFCGVIDERMDIDLVREVAQLRPDWQFVMIGPTAKISPEMLPRAANIHYLGMKRYEDLPGYFSGWDAAMMPFAHNDATRYISPTKTPEYLAAGCPVVSTSIRDVVRPYGEEGLVEIADTPASFVAAIGKSLTAAGRQSVERAASRLAAMSWDRTWAHMRDIIRAAERPAAVVTRTRDVLFRPVPARADGSAF